MTVTDIMLEELAKSYASEGFTVPAHLAVGTETSITSAVLTAQTEVAGEIGTRDSLAVSRINDQVTFDTIRSATSVLDTTNGDALTNVGFLSATTGGDLHMINVIAGITQTTAFDIEFVNTVTFGRQ